jgi:hypothetical protein
MAKKTVQVVIDTVKEEEKTLWQKIKDWFYHSETVFLAFVTSVGGAITSAVAGVLASTDYTSILNMLKSGLTFTKPQLVIMGGSALALGVIQYIARVRGTKAVDGQLLPKAA